MKKITIILLTAITLVSCSKVLITGRRQLKLVSDSEMSALSLQSYNEFMGSAKLSKDAANTALVNNVGSKITKAVEQYLKETGNSAMISNFSWKFSLVESSDVNAFCLPGGQIVFYEGILPYTKDETGIAIVMGHEIAHAVAKHSAERISQQIVVQYGAQITDAMVANKSTITRTAINSLYGIGTQVGVLLPYSRAQEYEADRLGLIFAAMAGYNPNEGVGFWQRMSTGGSNKLEFLSTHPTDQNRINKIKEIMPEAMKYYKK